MNSKKVRILKHVLLSMLLCGSFSGIVSSLEASVQLTPKELSLRRIAELDVRIAEREEQIENGNLYWREAELQERIAELQERIAKPQRQAAELQEELRTVAKPIDDLKDYKAEKCAQKSKCEPKERLDPISRDRLEHELKNREGRINQKIQQANLSLEERIKLNEERRATFLERIDLLVR
jgi:chromosome segregation ATPase